MPLIYIHGVAVRDENSWKEREKFLSHYILPIINPDVPENVAIFPVFWGDMGVAFAWDGISRPKTSLLGMGIESGESAAERAILLASTGQTLGDLPVEAVENEAVPRGLLAAGPQAPAAASVPTQRLRDLTSDQLSDLLATMIARQPLLPNQKTAAIIAADEVAHDPATSAKLQACVDAPAEIVMLQTLIRQRSNQIADNNLLGMGGGWFPDLRDRLGEILSRSSAGPGFVVSRLLGELRPVVNRGVTLFIGDVFVYLANRLAAPAPAIQPGSIPQILLDALTKAHAAQQQAKAAGHDEPIVVISHSMGGQIVYDAVTTFLPKLPPYQHIRIDFWCATASQVGLFEEMKLFLASDRKYGKKSQNKVPFPNRQYLGSWWNVWDVNDILSFTGDAIFEEIDDEFYDSGSSMLNAHGGYFERPSFYRRFAEKLKEAKTQNWHRS